MGDRRRPHPPAAVAPGHDAVSAVLRKADAWVGPYWNARHLRRTLHWLLELEPDAPEALRVAALTHDMERHVPGGPQMDPATMPPHDDAYRRAHSERSARIVGDWLPGQGAEPGLMREVERLVLAHETGGADDEDLLQAADSLSFLEVNGELCARWYTDGRCSRERSKEQLTHMFDRIRVARARELARPLHEEALALVDRA
jgi:hypothetical protein